MKISIFPVFSSPGDEDDLYESIYEVVNPPPVGEEAVDEDLEDDDFYSESDFDEIPLEEDNEEAHAKECNGQARHAQDETKRKSLKRVMSCHVAVVSAFLIYLNP